MRPHHGHHRRLQQVLSFTCSATSGGGTTSETVTIKRDATIPTLAPNISPGPVIVGSTATASPGASDPTPGSGLASSSCGAVDTSTAGPHTVHCQATDGAANTASVDHPYAVLPYGPSATITATGGGGQLAELWMPFTNPLSVRVTDAFANPVPDVTVGFTAPGSGASALLSASSATTSSTGIASVAAQANETAGAYSVSATVGGVSTPALFDLTNAVRPNTGYVSVAPSGFTPRVLTIDQGWSAQWDFVGAGNETATGSVGLGLFDSGIEGTRLQLPVPVRCSRELPVRGRLQPEHRRRGCTHPSWSGGRTDHVLLHRDMGLGHPPGRLRLRRTDPAPWVAFVRELGSRYEPDERLVQAG